MPKACPPEFRARAVALVRAGKPVRQAARELGISESCLHNWVKHDRIDRGERAGLSSTEHAELAAAKRRIRQLETELEILREASTIYEELKGDPKGVPGSRPARRAGTAGEAGLPAARGQPVRLL